MLENTLSEGTLTRGRALEKNFSAQPPPARQDAWIPGSHANRGWPQHTEAPAAKGPLPSDSMKGGELSQSFPKSQRLLRRLDFRRVYEEGRRGSARVCTIFYRSNGLPRTRLGITTPRAIGGAVVRNRIRRRLREVFRLNQAAIPVGWDIVLNPRPLVAELPFRVLEKEILRLFPSAPPLGSSSSGPQPG